MLEILGFAFIVLYGLGFLAFFVRGLDMSFSSRAWGSSNHWTAKWWGILPAAIADGLTWPGSVFLLLLDEW